MPNLLLISNLNVEDLIPVALLSYGVDTRVDLPCLALSQIDKNRQKNRPNE